MFTVRARVRLVSLSKRKEMAVMALLRISSCWRSKASITKRAFTVARVVNIGLWSGGLQSRNHESRKQKSERTESFNAKSAKVLRTARRFYRTRSLTANQRGLTLI